MSENIKSEIFKNRIQEILINDKGEILESDNAVIEITKSKSIGDIHPFFQSTIPILPSISESIKFPCVNIDFASNTKIVDVEFLRRNDKLILLLFDLTEHYQDSQPMVQEKNVASIAKNKLAFEQQLLHAKEEFKNNFLANLNHEIRNPLNNLLGFMELLKETRLDYDQNETLKVMQRTGIHIKILMDDMLDISKIERGVLDIKAVNFNLGHLVTNLQQHFQLKYHNSTIEFEVNLSNNVPRKLVGDPARLNQILFNLLENAFRNTKSGKISLNVTTKSKTKEKAEINFTISDSGTGIPKEKLDRIFDSYFQLQVEKMKPIGEGLGLKIVKDLTDSLNGNIKVVSEPEKGTTFQCILPFKIRPNKNVKSTIPKGSGILLSKRILIVEHETTNQMLFMKMFLKNEKGYVIEMAINAPHAMDLLENNKYSLVILKTTLAETSAAEFISNLRAHENEAIANMPVLVASGNTVIHEQKAVLDSGANAFLPKPFTKKELFNAIEGLIR